MKVNGVRKFIYSGKLNFTMVVFFFFIQKTELGFAIDFEMYFSLKWKEIVCTVFFVYIEKKNAVLVTCGPTYE